MASLHTVDQGASHKIASIPNKSRPLGSWDAFMDSYEAFLSYQAPFPCELVIPGPDMKPRWSYLSNPRI
jgi:hypothetical protein